MQEPGPMLSVVIPVTRMAGRLMRLTANLRACKGLDIEIILVHDEQDSKTHEELVKLVDELSSRNIKLIKKTVFSPGQARNIGINASKGSWIAFWDADDLTYPEGYLRLVCQAEETRADVGIGQIETTTSNSGTTKVRKFQLSGSNKTIINDLAYLPAFTRFVFRRDVFSNLSFPEYLLGEDLVFLANLDFLDFKLEIGREVIYNYFINENSQATYRTDLFTDLLKAGSCLYQNFPRRSQKMKRYLITQIIRINLSLLKNNSNKLGSFQMLLRLFFRNPIMTLTSCIALIRRRSEFRIR